ncbi:DUF4142 domain-containing protein [Sphingomonas sp. ID0503]|uniref:DUF4142 domain-containing protein n=1 Tax=Sphingomonas sp. ID0503 TaxID=3399691 RepID=UPI003AFA1BE5
MKALHLMIPAALMVAAPALAAAPAPLDFVKKAGASDLYEQESSKLVLATTQDPKVKSFASMMVTDHSKSTADVKAAAAKAGVTAPPPKLMPEQEKMIGELKAATGKQRDAAYIAQQKQAHMKALALHKGYATEGTAAPLKAAAAKIAPVVQHHIDMLKSM